jgi:ABC-type sugar transport system substrate-binding protein
MKNVSIIPRAGLALFGAALLLLSVGRDAPAAEKIVIGFSQATMNSTWRVAMLEGNQKYAAEHYPDVELDVTDGQNQSAKQISDVKDLLARGISLEKIEANLLSGLPLREIGRPRHAQSAVELPVGSAGVH